MECNFKVISSNGNADHVYWLNVICYRTEDLGYFYMVEGKAYGESIDMLISSKRTGIGELLKIYKNVEVKTAFALVLVLTSTFLYI